jgi:antitoxin component YwqK of YwqJK toxin-antitoxin module
MVSLQFYFQQDTFKTHGTVTAIRYIEPQPAMPFGGDTMRLNTWYKVTGTGSNTYAWHKGMNFLISSVPGTDVAYMSGFTDMGAIVACTLKNGRIHIPKHKTTTVPYGADGSVRMNIEVSGDGVMTDTSLSLHFFASYGGTFPDGDITAVKWKEERIADTTGQYVERIDTVINHYHYHTALYNKQGRLLAIGQEYDYNIKNGKWQYLDEQGKVIRMVAYEHDLLNGWYKDTTATSKEQGLYLEGKKAGRWVKQTRQKRKWITEWFETYDMQGRRISKVFTYANGLPAQETFYAADGTEIWYCNYDNKGNITYQGRYQLLYELSEKK